jgi:hypothetical protein
MRIAEDKLREQTRFQFTQWQLEAACFNLAGGCADKELSAVSACLLLVLQWCVANTPALQVFQAAFSWFVAVFSLVTILIVLCLAKLLDYALRRRARSIMSTEKGGTIDAKASVRVSSQKNPMSTHQLAAHTSGAEDVDERVGGFSSLSSQGSASVAV